MLDGVLPILTQAASLAFFLSLPIVLSILAAGLVAGLAGAAVQVNDPSLGFAARMLGLAAGVALFGPRIAADLVRFLEGILALVPLV